MATPAGQPNRETDVFSARWVVVRERGRISFIIRNGLSLAAITMVAVWLLNWATGWANYPWSGQMGWPEILAEFAGFLIAGIIYGLVVWNMNEKRYRTIHSS